MKNKDFLCICGLILFLIIPLIIVSLIILYPSTEKPWIPEYVHIAVNQTKEGDHYIFTIKGIVPQQVDPSSFEWQIRDGDGLVRARSNFPKKAGEDESSINKNITITWFDYDNNKKLSINDTIQIEGSFENIEKPEFVIIDEKYCVTKIEITK